MARVINIAGSRTGRNVVKQVNEDATGGNLVTLPLDEIGDRHGGDTRPTNPQQVEQLVESISLLGLIAPLAVDTRNRLLAGGHRLAALRLLREQDEPRFNDLFPAGIPCRKFELDSQAEPEQALAIEISENEKRRNYTRAEIRTVADRLREQGYSQSRGPKAEPSLTQTLSVAFGVSRRTVERALKPENTTPVAISEKRASLSLPAELVKRIKEDAKDLGQTPAEFLDELLSTWSKTL